MAILRRNNWISQQLVTVPDLRSLESAVSSDFDSAIQAIYTGTSTSYVVRGFELLKITSAIPANTIQLVVDPGSILHVTSLLSGTIYQTPTGTANITLNSSLTNSVVDGSFAPGTTNYVGIEYERYVDTTSSASVSTFDPVSNTVISSNKPRAQLLRFRVKITSTTWAANVLHIATVVVNASGNVTSYTDARDRLYRLGTGGATPNSGYVYPWTSQSEGRLENASTVSPSADSPFHGGDKMLDSQKDWMDAVMTKLKEMGGSTYWYQSVLGVSTNTASSLVRRDESGNFSAGTITANLTGNVTGTVTGHSTLDLAIANNLSDVASQTDSFDNLSPMTTGGDLIYGGASGTGTRLANGSAGQVLTSAGTTAAPTWETPTSALTQSYEITNLGLATSVAASELTINLKQADGSTAPGAGTAAVKIGFRSATAGNGNYNQRSVTGALSLVIPSGATLNTAPNYGFFLWLYAIDNAGTVELAVCGHRNIFNEGTLQSTTAISAVATTDNVLYSTTARTDVPVRLIGRLFGTEAVAGTWDTNIAEISLSTPNIKVPSVITQTFSASSTFTVPSNVTDLEVLIVGGGGGGGRRLGGGGGGGAVLFYPHLTVSPGQVLTVTVGAGGAGSTSDANKGTNGGNSVLTGTASATATGGGGGGSYANTAGANGGCGGGSSLAAPGVLNGYGNPGGHGGRGTNATANAPAGGGGGMCGNGMDGDATRSLAGCGGPGFNYRGVAYGAGGGGGTSSPFVGGKGGSSSGGTGGTISDGGTATINSGSGGGGGADAYHGGDGAAGYVIISYTSF